MPAGIQLMRAALVGTDFGNGDFLASLEELALLAKSAGAEPVVYQIQETLSEEILGKMHGGSSLKPKYPVVTPNDLKELDGFLFGFPTRYGRAPAQVSAFFDATGGLWATGALIGKFGGVFRATQGLQEEFGKDRIIDTPISEAGFSGLCVGAAMAGMRPICDIMFGDFLTIIMDQVVNQAAKIHYMSGGKWKVPMVLRLTMGASRRSAAQHSQSLHAWPSHVPGLKVVIPSTPYDAKGLMKTAIRDDNPVCFFEDKISYTKVKGPCPDDDYTIPFGVADIKREGTDITLIGTSSMVQVALGAAAMLEEVGINAEVVDPRTLWPLDEKTLIESAKKTSRAMVIDEGYFRYGVTGEIASIVQEGAFYDLDGPVRRIGAMHVPIPFSPSLEDSTVPNPTDVVKLAQKLCNRS